MGFCKLLPAKKMLIEVTFEFLAHVTTLPDTDPRRPDA